MGPCTSSGRVCGIAVGLAALVGCGSCGTPNGAGDGSPGGGQVVPLTVGNQWVYSYSGGALGSGTTTMTATATQSVGGVDATRIDYTGGIDDGYWILLENRGDDLNFHGDSIHGVLAAPDLWMRSTVRTGDTWETRGQGGNVSWEVLSISASITVGAGTFDCVHVRGTVDGAGAGAEHWWAIGIGWVRMVVPMGPHSLTYDLISYSFQ